MVAPMAEQPNDPLIGQEFNGYRIERRLAEGGMGAVYQVRHTELADLLKVAKVILPVVPAGWVRRNGKSEGGRAGACLDGF